eukprot:TRINITY_DN1940_c0_g1_i1.p1 TRINITY_DN1940_c0_g1~~TRINITY_DN1940_c0_g1_i1.p1  ORF type:complete len:390 (-),score=56.34 TRINITY_DN1940_c0_g1_i1:88-1257(-)
MNAQGDQYRAAVGSSYSFPLYNISPYNPIPKSVSEQLKAHHSIAGSYGNIFERQSFTHPDEALKLRANVGDALDNSGSCFVRRGVNPLSQARPCPWLSWKLAQNHFAPEFNPRNPAHGNFLLRSRMNVLLKETQRLTCPSTNFRMPFAPVPRRPPDFQIPSLALHCPPIQVQPLSGQCANDREFQAQEQSQKNRLGTSTAARGFAQAEELKVSYHKNKAAENLPIPKFKVQERQAKRKAFKQISLHLKKPPQSANAVCKELIAGRAYEVRNVYKSIIRHIYNYTRSNKQTLRDHLGSVGYTPEEINSSFDIIQKYNNPSRPKEIERNSQVRVEEMLRVKSPLTHILKKVLLFMLDKWRKGRVGQLATENLNVYYETCKKFLKKVEEIVR